jgi:hypothetical protein
MSTIEPPGKVISFHKPVTNADMNRISIVLQKLETGPELARLLVPF